MPKLRSRARSRNPTSVRSRNCPAFLAGRPRGCYPRSGRLWLSKYSLGLNQSQTWPGNMRSAASSSINKPTPPKTL